MGVASRRRVPGTSRFTCRALRDQLSRQANVTHRALSALHVRGGAQESELSIASPCRPSIDSQPARGRTYPSRRHRAARLSTRSGPHAQPSKPGCGAGGRETKSAKFLPRHTTTHDSWRRLEYENTLTPPGRMTPGIAGPAHAAESASRAQRPAVRTAGSGEGGRASQGNRPPHARSRSAWPRAGIRQWRRPPLPIAHARRKPPSCTDGPRRRIAELSSEVSDFRVPQPSGFRLP